MRLKTIKVGKDPFKGRDHAAIQSAVDEAAGGGIVELPAGTFVLRNAVYLRSGVALVGQGERTVLRKAPAVESPLADYLGYGHYEITLEKPEPFEPGMGVIILDQNAVGFYTTTATLLRRDGNAFIIDKMLNHDYKPEAGGRVINLHPLVAADCAANVAVRGLTIDGGDEPQRINGCRGGGVFLLQARSATVQDVEVTHFGGDAVSFQQCTDIVVRDCRVHHNRGSGLHPGSGSVRYLLAGNEVHHNDGDGIFYCLRTTHSLCARNDIHHNRGVGISVGERDTDHVLSDNDIRSNGGSGLFLRDPLRRGADRMLVEGNRFRGNGEPEVRIAPGLRDVVLRGNRFTAVKGEAVRIGQGAERIYLADNRLGGRPLAAAHVAGECAAACFGERPEPLHVGPAAAREEHALHLAVELPARPANFQV